jgi:cytochrome c oxidase subunit 2
MRVAHSTLLSLLFASGVTHADWTLNLTAGVTPISHDIYDLHMTIFWICVAIGVLVFSVMFYAIYHHRKSKNHTASQFHEHFWLEITWTIIPIIILTLMAIPATRVLIHIRNTEASDLTIKITGFQWKWRYEYLENGINFFSNNSTSLAEIKNVSPKSVNYLRTVDHPLVVPIHKKIRLLVTSNDVIHSWWVPDLGTKQDAIPGYIHEVWTRINRPGTYHGQCAELCGLNHAYMPIVVIAMAEKDYENWVLQQKGLAPAPASTTSTPAIQAPVSTSSATPPSAPTMEQQMDKGKKIFEGTCAVCHQISGEGMPPVYPALKGSKIVTGPVADHMHIVLFGKPGTPMQAFKDQFSDEELAAVITYERNSWGNKADPVSVKDVNAVKVKGQS